MRKIYLLIVLVLAASVAHAQNVSVRQDTLKSEGPGSGIIDQTTFILNNSSSSVNLQWERVENNIPAGWISYVCIETTCYSATTDAAPFDSPLSAGDSTYIIGYFEPNGNNGTGHFKVVIWDATDSANTNTVVDFFYNAWPLGLDDAAAANPRIFPVPAQDYLQLENVDLFETYTIYSLDGRAILTGSTADRTVVTSEMVQGVYVIEFAGKDQRYRQMMQKQ